LNYVVYIMEKVIYFELYIVYKMEKVIYDEKHRYT
jgi:hypothetical protein